MITPYSSIRRKIEKYFVDYFTDIAPIEDLTFRTSESDEIEGTEPPVVAVVCEEADEIIPGSRTYKANVRFIIATSLFRDGTDEKDEYIGRVMDGLNHATRKASNVALNFKMLGFVIQGLGKEDPEDKESIQNTIRVLVGAAG